MHGGDERAVARGSVGVLPGAALDFLEEQAAANPSFKEVWDSYRAFRDISFPYAAGNQLSYEQATFTRIGSADMTG